MSRKNTSVSRTPFATVGITGRCPSCRWTPEGGALHKCGISMALRIHCYREHGLRLRLGSRSRLPPEAAAGPIDLDAEVAAHLWIIDAVVRRWEPRPRDEVMQEARIALMSAILQWDGRKGAFREYAAPIIHRRAARQAARVASQPAGAPLRVMLPPPPDPAADPPLATPDDAVRAMRLLTDVQRTVLGMRFRDPPATLREAGALIGVSKERARQIEAKALSVLRTELAGEPTARRKHRRRIVRAQSLKPELFAVLWDKSPTKVDCFGMLRRADWDVMSVFTDKQLASRAANSLRKRIRKEGPSAVPKVRVVPVARPACRQELVDSPPARLGARDSMTADAVRDEMASHGPMTVAQIARRLVAREGYMEARHPSADPGDEAHAARAVRLAMKSEYLRMRRVAPCLYAMCDAGPNP